MSDILYPVTLVYVVFSIDISACDPNDATLHTLLLFLNWLILCTYIYVVEVLHNLEKL